MPALPKLLTTQHKIYFFEPFYLSVGAHAFVREKLLAATIRDIAPLFPIQEVLPARALWEDKQKYELSPDLHPHVAAILGNKKEATAFSGLSPLRLSDSALNHCRGQWKNSEVNIFGLRLGCSERAMERIKAHLPSEVSFGSLRLWLQEVEIYWFASGFILLVAALSYQIEENGKMRSPYPVEILEGNFLLTQNILRFKRKKEALSWHEDGLSFSFLQLLQQLIMPAGLSEESVLNRLLTYSTVRFAANLPDNELFDFAFRLARRYHSEYGSSGEDLTLYSLRPFKEIMHFVAMEGGALILQEDPENPGNDFIKRFIEGPVPSVYMPLALLTYHEFIWLLRITQDSAIPLNFNLPNHEQADKLQHMGRELLQFRLSYRFSHVSLISMHNQVYQKWREIFDLNEMLSQANVDVSEAEQYLQTLLAKERARQFRGLSVFTTSALAFIATNTLMVEAVLPIFSDDPSLWLRLVALGIDLTVAGLAGFFTYWQQRRS
jgi:hypothetical protein